MRFRAGLALTGALAMSGCAVPYTPAPVATNFPSTQQAKLQAAAHWGAIARHMAGQLAPSLKANARRPLYVTSQQSTAFAQGVSAHLVTALVNDGYVLVKVPDANALRIELDTQVVGFAPNRPQYKFAGERSALVAGAWVLTGIDHSTLWLASAAIAGQDAYAWFRSQFANGATPRTEIIVNLSLADDSRYYARTTSVYYTVDTDRALYDAASQPTKTFAVRNH
ncbi:hypothetical protein [Massilia yuzhufengensis]|uniref:Lipoprotein n=1 Tax=Massilia yuzhufengensis TaxID=1164594 RepID=A0A1I1VFX2_9BURK|nr:hypothetical protein [Massilia yuzhufengensis]SFD79340.1 hypothetical protein SAMN05216204_13814 [Massilia yuzhufengensis]